jgi:hypothetical protein
LHHPTRRLHSLPHPTSRFVHYHRYPLIPIHLITALSSFPLPIIPHLAIIHLFNTPSSPKTHDYLIYIHFLHIANLILYRNAPPNCYYLTPSYLILPNQPV